MYHRIVLTYHKNPALKVRLTEGSSHDYPVNGIMHNYVNREHYVLGRAFISTIERQVMNQ